MSIEIEDTWRIHNRIHLFLLKALNDDQLQLGPQAKGRTIGQLLAHIHDVRLMWLKAAAPGSARSPRKARSGTKITLTHRRRSGSFG